MKNQSPTDVDTRYHALDSLRGVAACTVVLCHFWAGMGAAAYLAVWHSPLRFLIAGHDAVILFFILSGFVLTLPYKRTEEVGYFRFMVKRICRIYLPYLGALTLAVAMNFRFHGLVTEDMWLNFTWSQKPDAPAIIQHVLFVGNYQWDTFNTAFWSLVYEMRVSLIFPFLALAVLRSRSTWMFVIAILTSLLSSHTHRIISLLHLDPRVSQFADTFHYLSFFILGAILAKNSEFIQARYEELPIFFVYLFSAIAIVSYYHPFDVPAFTTAILPPQKIVDWSVACGSLIVIALALCSGRFKSVLNHRAIGYLGKISYSLYLVHGTVLFTFVYICRGPLKLLYLPIYVLTVFGLASIFCYVIERPSIALGKMMGNTMSHRGVSKPVSLVPM